MTRLLAAVGLVVVLAGCDTAPTGDTFDQACAKRGGFTSVVTSSFLSTTYGCIVNNQLVYLPGFD